MRRLVLIGYGNIAKKHLPAFRALGADFIASCNRSEESNKLAQIEGGIPLVFSNYHKMISETKPDGILLCSSFWNNFEILKSLIPYNIPILAEKPSGISLAQHNELCKLVSIYGTKVMLGLNRRHYSVINNGIEALGGKQKITNVMVEWSEDPDYLKEKRGFSDDLIKLRIFENIHGLDLLTYIAGEITDYKINVLKFNGNNRYLMNLNGVSKTGALVNFNNTWNNFVPFRISIYGDGKRLILSPIEKCILYDGKISNEIQASEEDLNYKPGFYAQAKLFLSGNFNFFELNTATNSMTLAQSFFDAV